MKQLGEHPSPHLLILRLRQGQKKEFSAILAKFVKVWATLCAKMPHIPQNPALCAVIASILSPGRAQIGLAVLAAIPPV